MHKNLIRRPLPPHLQAADDDAIRELMCSAIDRGSFVESMWFRCDDHLLVGPVAGPRDAARDTWDAALFRLSEHPGLRARFRMGIVDDESGRAVCVLQWGPGEAWTAACRPLGPDGLPTGTWDVSLGEGYDTLRPGLLRWVDSGSRDVPSLDQLLPRTRLRPPVRRDWFDLPFEPVRNVVKLTEQLGGFFDVLVAQQGLPFRIVALVRGRRCVVFEVELDVRLPFDDFVRTVAAREGSVAAAVLSPERTPEGHEAWLLVESGGRRAERRARIVADAQGHVRPQASVRSLGKVRENGWIGVAPRSVVQLTDLGDTPGAGDD